MSMQVKSISFHLLMSNLPLWRTWRTKEFQWKSSTSSLRGTDCSTEEELWINLQNHTGWWRVFAFYCSSCPPARGIIYVCTYIHPLGVRFMHHMTERNNILQKELPHLKWYTREIPHPCAMYTLCNSIQLLISSHMYHFSSSVEHILNEKEKI